jgi:predicted nucleic acid-binding protein
VRKALLDTSTYVDIRRATRNGRSTWARNTLRNLVAYRATHSQLTVSVFTAYEVLDGIFRGSTPAEAQEFLTRILPAYEVIYPDEGIIALGAQINAALSKGRSIGMADTLIAATAITRKWSLVNANTKHFQRVADLGFPLQLENWRDP